MLQVNFELTSIEHMRRLATSIELCAYCREQVIMGAQGVRMPTTPLKPIQHGLSQDNKGGTPESSKEERVVNNIGWRMTSTHQYRNAGGKCGRHSKLFVLTAS